MRLFDLFIQKAIIGEGGGSDVKVESLTATENGEYDAGSGKAYNPVTVNVPSATLTTKSIAANGIYNASSDNADGYSSVTVNVPDTAQQLIDRSISSVTIPSTTSTLMEYLFCNCANITSLAIPETVAVLGMHMCEYCSNLEKISLSTNISLIPVYCFNRCTSLKSITLHEGITSIANYAFQVCSAFTNVKFPSTLTSIGSYAFNSCSSMVQFDCTLLTVTNGTVDTALSSTTAFNSTNNATFLFADQATMNAYAQATNWSSYASRMTYVGA